MIKLPDTVKTVVSSLHPAFAMRGNPQFKEEIRRIIRRASNWSRDLGTLRRPRVEIPTPEQLRWALEGYQSFSVDVETHPLDPEEITICSISPIQGPGVSYAFWWRGEYIQIMKEIMEDPRALKGGHNFSYDMTRMRLYGIEPHWPIFDTIQAGALLWPPQSRSRSDGDSGEVRWLALAACVLRVIDGVGYWKEPGTPEAQAFYRAAYPEFSPHQYPLLYCGLDSYYGGILWLAEKELLKRRCLWDLYTKTIAPAGLVLSRIESRGMYLDVNVRDAERRKTEKRIAEVEGEIKAFTKEWHQKRLGIIQEAIKELEDTLVACSTHPEYTGATKRSKCEGCAKIYATNKPIRDRIRKGKAKLKSVGPEFKPTSNKHWVWLLFDKNGLGLKPVSRTKKNREPQVNDDSIEKLYRKHKDLSILRWRVTNQHLHHRLSGPLSLEPSDDGRVRFGYSLHRTSTGRVASGADDTDLDKLRTSPANAMNQADKDRRMFTAPPGFLIVQADWSQAEMRAEAWMARELKMLQAWKDGADIHTYNALDLAAALGRDDITEENVREKTIVFDGQEEPIRQGGKKLGLGLIYGMKAMKMARTYGLKVAVCSSYITNFFERWGKIKEYQEWLIQYALEHGEVVSPFGRPIPITVSWDDRAKCYMPDREAALASPAQSVVGEMVKRVMPDAEGLPGVSKVVIPGSILDTTTHDSLRFTVRESNVPEAIPIIREIMEREWPELGFIPDFGNFVCPTDIGIGKNWGKYHPLENPDGLREDHGL